MESVPLIPKAKVLPNLDAVPLLRELFQDEFGAVVPSQKLSQNIHTSLQHEKQKDEELKPCGDKEYLENYSQRIQDVVQYTENVLKAYENHKKSLKEIRDVEKHIFEAHAHYLKREKLILENPAIRDAVCLKRQPLLKALSVNYVRKYKLLQGDAGLPYDYEAKSDFRVKKFVEWRKKLENVNDDNFCFVCFDKGSRDVSERPRVKHSKPQKPKKERGCSPKQTKPKTEDKLVEIFTTDPKILFFTNYKLGYIYVGHIKVKNTSSKPVQFLLKPMSEQSPFRVKMSEKLSMSITPGLGFQLSVEFTPKSLDNAAEDIVIVTEDGNRFLIPLIAYLEPPILKTHKEINEFTKDTPERIASSYIECGSCFTGDSKVIKLNFRCYRGSGEFFIMSVENWSTGNINTVTFENLLEIPPFRVYPVFFKVEKDQIIDLFVEFTPKYSGMQVENIVIACDNGQIRFLDLIGDAVGWHSYYFSFQDSLLKELSVDEDDDVKVKYYLNFEDTSTNGKVEKVFCVSNNSDMTFEFQWKIREANIMSTQEKYLKLSKYQVKIDPENGTFEPKSVWEFLVTITFNNAETGNYRMVLRYMQLQPTPAWAYTDFVPASSNLNRRFSPKRPVNCHNYEKNLTNSFSLEVDSECIEEDTTIIQPTGLVRNLYSQSLYGEEEASALSPELTSLQGTYESLQESIKSYMEFQNRAQAAPKQDFCRSVCAANPGLCAKPLKKSKTLFNIGETLEDLEGSRQMESNSESCTSNRDEKMTEMSPQRNEIIWDFVDILVDEVELWVEVVPTRVTLQPSILELSHPIFVNASPVYKEVRIINHNRSPVTCSWLMPSKMSSTERSSDLTKTGSTMLSLLFDKNSLNKVQTNSIIDSENPKNCNNLSGNQSEEKGFVPSSSKESTIVDLWDVTIKPWKEFMVPGLSEVTCKIAIVAYQPGQIKDAFWLNINEGDLQLKMIIKGLAVVRDIETSPEILDFGVVKQGTRYTENFTITSQCSLPVSWKINHFKFDFKEGKFHFSDVKETGSIKNVKGVLAKKGSSITQPYCLNARAPGIKCSLIEVERINVKGKNSPKNYIMVLADVRMPKVWLSAPRFENAILALSGTMYVGQTQKTSVTLTNKGIVEAFLTWGYPFGCHCRKIKVEISPKTCRIDKKQKLTINFSLTPLEEGIVNHCYIPCFFSRSAEPLILSIVGVAHTVNVTFEVIDYPMQNHADASSFLKSPFHHTILRIPWPVKMYNPTLGLKYLTEMDVLNLNCHCQEVEEDAARAFNDVKHECTRIISQKTTRSLRSFEMSESGSFKSKSSFGRSIKTLLEEDAQGVEYTAGYITTTLDSKKSEENSLCALSIFENLGEAIHFSKSHLEFLNVPFRTTSHRQFVIRNETPIDTNFQISVANYGVSKNFSEKRLEIIKNRVFGYCNDEFQNKLMQDQPLVFEVEPSKGELKGFEAISINVCCYGNTWGEYRDYLICQIKGIEAFNLKIFAQIVGHPLYFPNFQTNTSQRATLRFQPLSPVEPAVWKLIKVVNRSSIPLDISWMVFLTKPLPNIVDHEESNVDACADSVATLELNPSDEGSTQSSKNYIPKNTSDPGMESKDFSQTSESKNQSKPESISSVKKEKRESGTSDKKSSPALSGEETRTDTHFQFPGVLDVHTFQVKPKEMSFKPFEEKKIMITFNPDNYRTNPQEVKGVLTGCVKLKPEHENCPGLYYRPCGIGFVSELLDFSAAVEIPLVSLEIPKGDLRFIVDSNAVINSEKKTVTILRKFFIKNLNQKSLCLKIDVIPGTSFEIKNVNTIDKFYPEYNSKCHPLQIEGGHILEMELQCTVSYKNIMYAFEQLKINRLKEECSQPPESGDIKKPSLGKYPNVSDNETDTRREPWKHYQKNKNHYAKRVNLDYCKLGHNDSFHLNINRMSSKSDNSTCYDFHEGKIFTSEFEGEYLELPCVVELPCKPEQPKHVVVSKEEIVITHSGSVTQTLMAELHISFPIIKISPQSLDFGSVYLGETSTRYCSLINLTGFPVVYRVVAKFNGAEFVASPLTGNLPSANYNCDVGTTLTLKFTPSQPGNYSELFYVYCNMDLEFDFFELSVFGLGTWDEKYKNPKYICQTKIDTLYSKRST